MYDEIISKIHSESAKSLSLPDLELGLGIKSLRLRMGMTQAELAHTAGIKPAALKTLENGYAKFTTLENLERLAAALKSTLADILSESRERVPAHFFVIKSPAGEPPVPKRRRKFREELHFSQKHILLNGCRIDTTTPPAKSGLNFSALFIEIPPGHALDNLYLPYPAQIAGAVRYGSVKIIYDGEEQGSVFANQGFSLRGDKIHSFQNLDRDNIARIVTVFPAVPRGPLLSAPPPKHDDAPISVGRAIKLIRRIYSPVPNRSMTIAELARKAGLDAKSLSYLENTTRKNQVIYWDKVETLTQALKLPFDRFLALAAGRDPGYFFRSTAHDRALIDYRHYLGVRIKSMLFPGAANEIQLFEMHLEPKGGIRRLSWKRRDDAKFMAFVDDGELLVEVGKNRKVLLGARDSLYFDGSLGYIFTNPGPGPAKLLMAACPPIIF